MNSLIKPSHSRLSPNRSAALRNHTSYRKYKESPVEHSFEIEEYVKQTGRTLEKEISRFNERGPIKYREPNENIQSNYRPTLANYRRTLSPEMMSREPRQEEKLDFNSLAQKQYESPTRNFFRDTDLFKEQRTAKDEKRINEHCTSRNYNIDQPSRISPSRYFSKGHLKPETHQPIVTPERKENSFGEFRRNNIRKNYSPNHERSSLVDSKQLLRGDECISPEKPFSERIKAFRTPEKQKYSQDTQLLSQSKRKQPNEEDYTPNKFENSNNHNSPIPKKYLQDRLSANSKSGVSFLTAANEFILDAFTPKVIKINLIILITFCFFNIKENHLSTLNNRDINRANDTHYNKDSPSRLTKENNQTRISALAPIEEPSSSSVQ